jgi:hypothetical protein|tara:strand:+ start:2077 stop:2244 length:168 start_codon:yes stop_codon:yes gene_type:complete
LGGREGPGGFSRIVLDGLRGEVTGLRREAQQLKDALAEQMLENRFLKKSMIEDIE